MGTFPTEPANGGEGVKTGPDLPAWAVTVPAVSEQELLPPELDRLAVWMRDHHLALREQTVAKAGEYGALDLKVMGASLAEVLSELGGDDAPPAAKLQAAIAFYLLGKVSRVISALAEGKPAPTDSWLDAEVYSMMGSYVQEHGQWP